MVSQSIVDLLGVLIPVSPLHSLIGLSEIATQMFSDYSGNSGMENSAAAFVSSLLSYTITPQSLELVLSSFQNVHESAQFTSDMRSQASSVSLSETSHLNHLSLAARSQAVTFIPGDHFYQN